MNMPIIVRLATKADLSNRSAAVALRDFEPAYVRSGSSATEVFMTLDLGQLTQRDHGALGV